MRSALMALLVLVFAWGAAAAAPVLAQDAPADGPPGELCQIAGDVPFLDPAPMLRAINQHRLAIGAPLLQTRDSLTLMARAKAAEIYHGGELDHFLNGRFIEDRARDCGYPAELQVTEDLGAAGGLPTDAATLEYAVNALLTSDAHRSILENSKAFWIGAAAVKNPDGLTVYMLVFGGVQLLVG